MGGTNPQLLQALLQTFMQPNQGPTPVPDIKGRAQPVFGRIFSANIDEEDEANRAAAAAQRGQ